MARRRWYRRSTRVVAAKKKWASNIVQGDVGSSAPVGDAYLLASNAVQSSSTPPTPVIVKVGNFKVQGDAGIANSTEGFYYPVCNIFILYIPEGISSTTSDLNAAIRNHPEWVMGWTCVDVPSAQTTGSTTTRVAGNKFSITNRLKRNLNSGDRIYLFVQYSNEVTCNVHFTAQFWTCAN